MSEDPDLKFLNRSECLRLLASATVGRVLFTHMSLPTAHPVTFVLDGNAVIFQTKDGSTLAEAVDNRVVSLEVDEVDIEQKRRWWINVIGNSHTVTDPAETDRLSGLPLLPWGSGEHQHFVRIKAQAIQGWRLRPAE
ncbi:pyridoxamine 5'-phosphate oxidase family protein [Actinopolymorpha sp. B11F2]|uniref:pyridoxamine 5'-phosphate oxidase family protein n=1 Tax=Actinopolymorpha sp. B11F2 TaxID=3160862 RepID=UPI0032E3AEBC